MSTVEATTTSPSLLRALQAKRRWFEAVAENGRDGVTLFQRDGTILYVTPSARVWGLDSRAMIGRKLQDLTLAVDRPSVDAMLLRVTALPPGAVDEERCRRINAAGKEVWIDVVRSNHLDDPDLGAIVSRFRDVTDVVHAEQARERAERSYRGLVEALPEVVLVHRRGRVVWCNPAAERILGVSLETLKKSPVETTIHPDDRAAVAARIAETSAGRATPARVVRGIRPDGSTWYGEWTGIPCVWDGEPATFALARDVTERRRLEAQLAISDRMASVGQLAAGVAHEINNPLAALMANLSVVERELRDAIGAGRVGRHDEAMAFVREIEDPLRDARESAQRVRDIVRDLKIFSRAEDPARKTAIDVRRTVESAVRLAQNEIKHRARVVTKLDEVPPVEGNESRLGQVLLNLIVNAAQAIPDGHANDNEIALTTRVEGAWVITEVRDTGCGMTPEVQKRLFEPFFTTKPLGEGTGLGLPISQQIVCSMGGSIEIESAPGKGSTFRVRLPAAPDAEEATPANAYPVPSTAPARRGRVLVVDDELSLAKAISRSLSRHHEVTIATSGREGLALLEAAGTDGAPRFDVVLCDLMMPEVGGAELHDAVARRDARLASSIIFLTGGAFTSDARKFLERAPNLRFDKPVDLDVLRAIVDERIR